MARGAAGETRIQPNSTRKSKVQEATTASAVMLSVGSTGAPIFLKRLHIAESSGNATTATVRIVKSGGVDDRTSNIITAQSLAANETVTHESAGDGDWHVLEAGDSLKILASANTRVVFHAVYDLEL